VAAAFDPTGERVVTATAASKDNARIWDARTGEPIGKPLQHADKVVAAAFNSTGEHVVTASQMSEWRSACVMAPYPPELLPNTPRRPVPPHPKRCSIWGSISKQEIFPSAGGSRVDVLIAAEPGEAIGKGDDNGWHALFADQQVETFRQILAEADPIRLG
jgi:hypothetical protein